MGYVQGSYEWWINASMPQDGSCNLKEWRQYMNDENKKFVKSFNLVEGQKIKVLIGGKKMKWFTGTLFRVSLDLDVAFLVLHQTKSSKYIYGSEISDVKVLD